MSKSTMSKSTIVWFSQDLRVDDNPALSYAATRGPVVPVYVWDPVAEAPWTYGGASKVWLHHSLKELQASLAKLGAPLLVLEGDTRGQLLDCAQAVRADEIVWNRRYEPHAIRVRSEIKEYLGNHGISARECFDTTLFDPSFIRTQKGLPFQVFTPFWNECTKHTPAPPLRAPTKLISVPVPDSIKSIPIDTLPLLPQIPWDATIRASWQPGCLSALSKLKRAGEFIETYRKDRDYPSVQGTSRLSPHLHFGEISPRRVWYAISEMRSAALSDGDKVAAESMQVYIKELGWREFAYHMLFNFPDTESKPLRSEFAKFPWNEDAETLRAWKRGQTGYPIVDAGMRELWSTGWMHNRVRMIVASFLVKDLLINWREGAAWFWDTLVDADLANNTMGWQWSAGCGADAAPFFRIFNPYLQSQKFDPDALYIRKWLPELAQLPPKYAHNPSQAPPLELMKAGVTLGKTYPMPIVDHDAARRRALDVFKSLK